MNVMVSNPAVVWMA